MGLRMVGEQPDLFARVVVANATLPVIPKDLNPLRVPNPVKIDCGLGDFVKPADFAIDRRTWTMNFQKWIIYALIAPNFTPSQVVSAMAVNKLAAAEARAYDAPYPSLIYKAAVRTFPSMIAAVEKQNAPAWKALGKFKKPFLFLAGKLDENMGSETNQKKLTTHVPGAKGQPHERFNAGHFIQEDIGETLAGKVIRFIGKSNQNRKRSYSPAPKSQPLF